MAKEVVNTFVYRGVTAEIVKAGNTFSFSIHGTHEGRHIDHCAYCGGLWVSQQDTAEGLAKTAIDDKIGGTFRPHFAQRHRPKPAKMVTIFESIGGRKYGIIKKVKKDG